MSLIIPQLVEGKMGKKTHIAFILDRSGSMHACRSATLTGLNEQISKIRKEAEDPNVETLVSFYTFNRYVEPKYKCRSVNFLEDVEEKDYVTQGDTALYDAVGQAILDLKADTDWNNPDNAYLFVIVTDGEERCSRFWNANSLAKLISECQDSGRWTFTYLGANQDLSKVANLLKIPKGNIANYASNNEGSKMAWSNNTKQLDTYLKLRKRGITQVKSFHSNTDEIVDYTKVDLNNVSNFDHTKLSLEKAETETPKSIWRKE